MQNDQIQIYYLVNYRKTRCGESMRFSLYIYLVCIVYKVPVLSVVLSCHRGKLIAAAFPFNPFLATPFVLTYGSSICEQYLVLWWQVCITYFLHHIAWVIVDIFRNLGTMVATENVFIISFDQSFL